MQKFPDPVIVAMHHAGTTVTCMPVQIDPDGTASPVAADMAGNQSQTQLQADTSIENVTQAAQLSVDDGWESAVFFVLPLTVTNKETKSLFPAPRLFPVELEADLIEHEKGTLIELGLEIDFGLKDKPSGRVFFLTGHIASHFEAVQLLGKQDSIGLFIGDVHCNLLHQQRIPLGTEHRSVFDSMLQEALRRDALIRMTGTYDPEAVFDSVAENS